MLILPPVATRRPIRKFSVSGSGAASNSYAAPGTGLVFVPIYAHWTATTAGLMNYRNGTNGSILFSFRAGGAPTYGSQDLMFYEEPSQLLANQAAVLEVAAGASTHEFHVYAVVLRAAAGQDGLGQ